MNVIRRQLSPCRPRRTVITAIPLAVTLALLTNHAMTTSAADDESARPTAAPDSDEAPANTAPPVARVVPSGLPEMPETLTSFGGAVAGGNLYLYGGHTGHAHSYSTAEQSNRFYRLDLQNPAAWKELASGPRLQGLAMVAHGDSVVRLGGFTAHNAEGEEQDLHSQDQCARWNPAQQRWDEIPPLPEPRSSHDAAALGSQVYVCGGWSMQGEAETVWHATAWRLDLDREGAKWEALPDPPLKRRALAVAAFDQKLFMIGGMRPEEGPTKRVDIFDPQTGAWTQGPDLLGEEMNGFGSAAFACNGRLYVTTIRGDLQRLSKDQKEWERLIELEPSRFFHRMVPDGKGSLLLLGGANMSVGKFSEIDRIELADADE